MRGGDWSPHEPVLLKPVIDLLMHDPSGIYLDATAGGGGHIKALLDQLSKNAKVIAFDCDSDAIDQLKTRFADEPRVRVVKRNFRQLGDSEDIISSGSLSGILFDYGVSSHQLDISSRGFSYRMSGPLDMRMDESLKISADMVVNEYSEKKLILIPMFI